MYVLHAHWHAPTSPKDAPGMFFWAEDSEAYPPKKPRRSKAVREHPFCVSSAGMWEVLTSFGVHLMPVQEHYMTVLLPGNNNGPQPSPDLRYDDSILDTTPTEFARWKIKGVLLDSVAALTILTHLPADKDLAAHLTYGPDIQYWQVVARLVLETLAQQKVMPALVPGPKDTLYARWLPVLDGTRDGPRLARLVEAMPPLCRAGAKQPDETPSPRWLLDNFLNVVTDAVVRHWGRTHAPRILSTDVGEQWLKALFDSDPVVNGTPGQLGHLQHSYQTWIRNLHMAGDKTFRIAFRLEAPTQAVASTDEKAWQLHFMLQARSDPSLLVPAPEVWESEDNALQRLNEQFDQPREKLLMGLGYASRFFEPLQHSLTQEHPSELDLSTSEAFHFLRDTAPLLETSGFGVLVPPWWNKPGRRLGARAKMSSDAVPKSAVGLDNLVRFKWEMSLGDTTLSKEEFDALVALKAPLVQIRGQWVQLDPDQIDAAIQFWETHALEEELSLHEAAQMALGHQDTENGLPIEEIAFEGWVKSWMAQFTGQEKLTELDPPDHLQATLRPYQQYGYSWLTFLKRWGMGACLADDMGLGKTIQTIAMLLKEKEENGSLPAPTLLICPTSVVNNWSKEVARFAPSLTTWMHQGPDRLREDKFVEKARSVDMVLTSYALARIDAKTMQQVQWHGVILDEAQNIKNPEAKQTQAIRQLPAQFRLALTGTPVENRLSELWSIMNFLNPGYLGARTNFRQNYALPIERYGDETATQRLKRLVNPLILRRVKTDPSVIQDLPDKLETKVYCALTPEQATLYESVVQATLKDIEASTGMQRRGLVLSMLMRLKQICNHPAQFLHQYADATQLDAIRERERSGKLERLVEMLEEIIQVGDRTLIFTQYAEMGRFLKDTLQQIFGVSALYLHGGTPAKQRPIMVNRFQEEESGPPIFILSLKAGGTGLNLTRANHVFHFDRWWNPAVENQATDRAYRIGQRQNVQVHKFICAGTLEEMINDMIESKKALADSVVGEGENWLTELSTDELREVVTLRR